MKYIMFGLILGPYPGPTAVRRVSKDWHERVKAVVAWPLRPRLEKGQKSCAGRTGSHPEP